MKRYTLIELKCIAKERGYARWAYMSKDYLCKLLDIVRVEHLPKYELTNVDTDERTQWRSTSYIGKTYGVNTGNASYALNKGKSIMLCGNRYTISSL